MVGLQHYVSQPTNALLETKLIKYEKLLQTVPERSIPTEVAVGDWYNGWIEGISVHPNFMGLCIRNTKIYWFCSVIIGQATVLICIYNLILVVFMTSLP